VSSEAALVNHLDLVNKVASEYLKGLDASEISKALNIPRAKVTELLTDWRVMAANNQAIHARAKEALAGADQHFSSLIKKAYEVIDSADSTANLTAKTTSIKLIADIESKRLEMLQKAGLLDNQELADELLETERKQEILISILKEVTSSCDSCRPKVLKKLSQVNEGGVVIIDN
jgi:sugar-specific transcriptional regulator TrmB